VSNAVHVRVSVSVCVFVCVVVRLSCPGLEITTSQPLESTYLGSCGRTSAQSQWHLCTYARPGVSDASHPAPDVCVMDENVVRGLGSHLRAEAPCLTPHRNLFIEAAIFCCARSPVASLHFCSITLKGNKECSHPPETEHTPQLQSHDK